MVSLGVLSRLDFGEILREVSEVIDISPTLPLTRTKGNSLRLMSNHGQNKKGDIGGPDGDTDRVSSTRLFTDQLQLSRPLVLSGSQFTIILGLT